MRFYGILPIILAFFFIAPSANGQTDSIAPELLRNRPVPKKKPREYTVPDPTAYGASITTEDMDRLIKVIAGDSMQGRETGTDGQRKAAQFIASQFEALNLGKAGDNKSYYQYFSLSNDRWKVLELEVGGEPRKNLKDFYIVPGEAPESFQFEAKEIVYVGHGIDTDTYSDYKKAKVKGKIVLADAGEPVSAQGKYLVSANDYRSDWSFKPMLKAAAAAKMGAKAIMIVDDKFEQHVKENRRTYAGYGWQANRAKTPMPIPVIYISPKMAQALIGSNPLVEVKKQKAAEGASQKAISLNAPVKCNLSKETKTLDGSNVVGYLEGTDSIKKQEIIVITAHYDHLGIHDSLTFNGADDNASGTAGVLEMAEAFAKAAKAGVRPKRSVLFMLVSGEEKGLLGSEFYTNFPLFPLKSTVCNINTDMIGRIDEPHKDNPNYIYVIGSDRLSTELHQINEEMNDLYTHMTLDYQYNAPDDPNHYYERSDHYNFAKNGIPAIFYFNGTHADYHKATDTVEKIVPDVAALRARLAFYTAWDIAFRPNRLKVDKK